MTVTANIAPYEIQRFFDAAGVPLDGGKLFTYAAGTTTKQTTYKDSTGGTPNTNPIILDSAGYCNLWLDATLAYKFTLSPATDTDPPTNPIWTVDQLNTSASPVLTALAASSGSSLVGFLQSGANTVATDLQTRGREWVSVFDFMTPVQIADVIANTAAVDVTTALQNALNDGRALYAPAGTYSYTALYFDSCPMFVGAGQNKTILKPTAVAGNKITFGLNSVCQWGYYGHFSVAGNATTLIGIQLGGANPNYCANATFEKIRITGFTAATAAGVYLQYAQDCRFLDPVIKGNYRNVYRPDPAAPGGTCTTISFEGKAGMVELSTGDASIYLDGQVEDLNLDGVTCRSNNGSAIIAKTPVNNVSIGTRINLRNRFYIENNNTGGAATADIVVDGDTGSYQGTQLYIESASFHTAHTAMQQLSLDYCYCLVRDAGNLYINKITTTANTKIGFIGTAAVAKGGGGENILTDLAALSGGVFSMDTQFNLGYWWLYGPVNFPLGIIGTTTNDSAAAGKIGEYIEADTNGTPVNSTGTGQWFDVASIALTKGDWDLSVMVVTQANGSTMTAGTGVAVSSTAGNSTAGLVLGNNLIGIGMPTATNNETGNIKKRVSIAATQTWYAKCNLSFSAGTPRAFATIQARRIR